VWQAGLHHTHVQQVLVMHGAWSTRSQHAHHDAGCRRAVAWVRQGPLGLELCWLRGWREAAARTAAAGNRQGEGAAPLTALIRRAPAAAQSAALPGFLKWLPHPCTPEHDR